jgi:hypothetical protein
MTFKIMEKVGSGGQQEAAGAEGLAESVLRHQGQYLSSTGGLF